MLIIKEKITIFAVELGLILYNFFVDFITIKDLETDEEEAIGGANSLEADAHEARLSRRHLDDAADYEGEEQAKICK